MSHHKKKHVAPVPPGNRPQGGPPQQPGDADQGQMPPAEGAPLSDQDEKRRLGNYQTAGEHSIKQPGGKKRMDPSPAWNLSAWGHEVPLFRES